MTDRFPIRKIDHLRFYCGNALHAAEWYRNKFGFDIIGYSGLETGSKNEASYLLQQGDVRFLMTSSLRPDDPIGALVGKHGDFVRDVCFEVDSVEESFKNAVGSGAEPVNEPHFMEDSFGKVHLASIKTYGDVIHTFLNRDSFSGIFLPNFVPMDKKGQKVGLQFVDHVVGNVELGRMNYWAQWYAKVLNFEQLVHFDDKDISTEYTALMSKVMQSGNGRVKFPINEPAEGKKKSQIDEYLEFHGGAGVQHIAIHTEDIIKTISELRKREIEFLAVPKTYYDTVTERVGEIQEPLDVIADLGILVDRDDEGYLLQLFTKPVETRPTLFFEIIQRRGAKSFGKGNFKALFEAIEREQQLRGTL